MEDSTNPGKPDTASIDPALIRTRLDEQGVLFDALAHEPVLTLEKLAQQLFIPLHEFARSCLLQDSEGFAIAVLPVGSALDFKSLQAATGRQFEQAWPEDYAAVFPRMNNQSIPPLTLLYEMPCYVDTALVENEHVYLPDGSGVGLLKLTRDDFLRMQHSPQRLAIALYLPMADTGISVELMNKARQMRERISKLDSLPPMPNVAAKLLQLSCGSNTMPADVARVIEEDPAIVAQVMHYACSPWYGFSGEIDSVEKAIFSVLGLDMVTNIALGMSAGRVFSIPQNDYMSARRLWQHAVYCAALSEALSRNLPTRLHIKPGTAYLAGLLHNIGFLALGHCFPEEFMELADAHACNPAVPVIDLEKQLFGINHAELGAELMRQWQLPGVIIEVIGHHHEMTYQGEHASEVLLVLLANRLLAQKGVGDEAGTAIPAELLDRLGLDRESVIATLESIVSGSMALDAMVDQLAA